MEPYDLRCWRGRQAILEVAGELPGHSTGHHTLCMCGRSSAQFSPRPSCSRDSTCTSTLAVLSSHDQGWILASQTDIACALATQLLRGQATQLLPAQPFKWQRTLVVDPGASPDQVILPIVVAPHVSLQRLCASLGVDAAAIRPSVRSTAVNRRRCSS